MEIKLNVDVTLDELEKMWQFPSRGETDEEQKIRMKRNELLLQIGQEISDNNEKLLNMENDLIGRTLNLDLGSSSPVNVTIKEITDTKVIVEYNNSTPGRTEEFIIGDFECLSGLKIR